MPVATFVHPLTRSVVPMHLDSPRTPGLKAGVHRGSASFELHPLYSNLATQTKPTVGRAEPHRAVLTDNSGPKVQDFWQQKPATLLGAAAHAAMGTPWLAPVSTVGALVERLNVRARNPKLAVDAPPRLGPYEGDPQGPLILGGGLPPARRPDKEEYLAGDPDLVGPQHSGRPEQRWVGSNEGLVPVELPRNLNIHWAASQESDKQVSHKGFDIPHVATTDAGPQEVIIRSPKWGTAQATSVTDPVVVKAANDLAEQIYVKNQSGLVVGLSHVLEQLGSGGQTLTEEKSVVAALEKARRESPTSIDWAVIRLLDTHVDAHRHQYVSAYRDALLKLNTSIGQGTFAKAYRYPDGVDVAKVFTPVLTFKKQNGQDVQFQLDEAQLDQLVSETVQGLNELSTVVDGIPPAERVAMDVSKQKYFGGVPGTFFPERDGPPDYGYTKSVIANRVNEANRYFSAQHGEPHKVLTGPLEGWRLMVDPERHNFLFDPNTAKFLGWIDPTRVLPPAHVFSLLR